MIDKADYSGLITVSKKVVGIQEVNIVVYVVAYTTPMRTSWAVGIDLRSPSFVSRSPLGTLPFDFYSSTGSCSSFQGYIHSHYFSAFSQV